MKFQTANSAERIAKEECTAVKSKLAEVESQLSTSCHKLNLLQMQLEQQKTETRLAEQELTGLVDFL